MSRKILIVEDDETTASFIAHGLEEHGFTTDRAANGRDGLFLATDGTYDAVVLDRMLPQMDGMAVLGGELVIDVHAVGDAGQAVDLQLVRVLAQLRVLEDLAHDVAGDDGALRVAEQHHMLVREQGIAQTVDQAADGAAGTAAVVRDATGMAIGSLVVAAPSSRIQKKRAELARLVREEAGLISASLGYRSPKR